MARDLAALATLAALAALTFVLPLLACRPPAAKHPDHGDPIREGTNEGTNEGAETQSSARACAIELRLWKRIAAGDVVRAGVEVRGWLPDPGGPVPTLVVGVTGPNGQRLEQRLEMVGEETCIECLPTAGSSGCDSECRYEPYHGGSMMIGPLWAAGEHRIDLGQEHSACDLTLSGGWGEDEAIVEVVAL